MKPVEITLNVSKINKDKIISRSYTNNEGTEVTVKEYKVKLVPLKERKFVTKGDGWEMFKTHFVVESKSKKEDPDNFVGEGFEFEKVEQKNNAHREPEEGAETISPDDIPF